MTKFIKIAALCLATSMTPLMANSAFAGEMSAAKDAAVTQDHGMMKDHSFAKKTYAVKGDYSIIQENGQTIIRLSDDFKTKKGPDLKVFLSPLTPDAVNGDTATQGSINLGALKTNKGSSDYILPAGVTLANYQSVLIHCEAYSKLWGAAQL